MNNNVPTDPGQFNSLAAAQLPPTDQSPPNTDPISIQKDTSKRPLKVFISYAHKDHLLCSELVNHLTPLIISKQLEIWYAQEIPAGENWEDNIDTHLKGADVILLLVSSNFIASRYCWNKEVLAALERHKEKTALVIPIILRPVKWQSTPLGQLQALPTAAKPVIEWDNDDAALENVVQGIERAINRLRSKDENWSKKIKDKVQNTITKLPKRIVILSVIILLFGFSSGGIIGFFVLHPLQTQPGPTETPLPLLGGLDLNKYCQHYLNFTEATDDDSFCVQDIDMTAACNWQWDKNDLTATSNDLTNRNSWHCISSHDPQWNNENGIQNMSGYCKYKSQNDKPEAYFEPSKSTWICRQKIDTIAACRWQYMESENVVQARKNDAGLWSCYGFPNGKSTTSKKPLMQLGKVLSERYLYSNQAIEGTLHLFHSSEVLTRHQQIDEATKRRPSSPCSSHCARMGCTSLSRAASNCSG